MKKWRVIAMGAVALATATTAAYAAGLFPGFPIVGGASYSAGLVTVPAGPTAITAGTLIPADTALTQGQNPATVLIPVEQLALFSAQPIAPTRNFIRNGDISVNPFQRLAGNTNVENVTQAAPLPSLPIVQGTIAGTADGFSMKGGSTSSQILYSKQTAPASVVAGQFTASLRMRRNTGVTGDAVQYCQHAVVQSANTPALQGQKVVYSFWAHAGAGFSATSSQITANLVTGTGLDEGAAKMQAGTWTGQATPATATILLTGTWTQYVLTGTIPSGATEVGTDICWTPSGVGSAATDFIETANHQLEIVQGNVVSPSAFEHHTVQQDLAVAQAYLVVFNEGTNSGAPIGICPAIFNITATNVCDFNAPVTMRTTPTTANSTPQTAGSFKLLIYGTSTQVTSPIITQSTSTMLQISVSNVATGSPATFSWGSVGAGQLTFSAELL